MICKNFPCKATLCSNNDFGYCAVIPIFERPYEDSPHEECVSERIDEDVLEMETSDEIRAFVQFG